MIDDVVSFLALRIPLLVRCRWSKKDGTMTAKKKTKPTKTTTKRKPPRAPVVPPLPPRDPNDPNAPLTPAEDAFVSNYLRYLCAGRAYLATHPHVTRQTAYTEGHHELRKPNVHAEIWAALRELRRIRVVEANKIIDHDMMIVTADPIDCVDRAGDIRSMHDVPHHTRQAVSSWRIRRKFNQKGKRVEEDRSFKMASKDAALTRLYRYLRLEVPENPVDAVLAAFPAPLAAQVRAHMAAAKAVPSTNGKKH